MSEKLFCPRGDGPDSPFKAPFNGEMHWRDDVSCSYCGSLHPDIFMERLEKGDIKLGPTDKSYKVYVENMGGKPLGSVKFYFQHLSEAQKTRFIELLNHSAKLNIGFPGYFYTLPFFIGRAEKSA